MIEILIRIQVVFPSPYTYIVDNIFGKQKARTTEAPLFLIYPHRHTNKCAAPWTYKRKGRYSHKYSRFNLNNMSRSCLVTFTFCNSVSRVVISCGFKSFFHTSLSSEFHWLKVFCFVKFDWSFMENTYVFGYPRCSEK